MRKSTSKVVPIRRQIVIEKKVPLPSKSIASKYSYPFEAMVIGDSFVCQPPSVVNFRSAVAYAQRKLRVRFTTRRVSEGIRVWRIE